MPYYLFPANANPPEAAASAFKTGSHNPYLDPSKMVLSMKTGYLGKSRWPEQKAQPRKRRRCPQANKCLMSQDFRISELLPIRLHLPRMRTDLRAFKQAADVPRLRISELLPIRLHLLRMRTDSRALKQVADVQRLQDLRIVANPATFATDANRLPRLKTKQMGFLTKLIGVDKFWHFF